MSDLRTKALEFIRTITDDELDFIAALDYGQEQDKHRLALTKFIFEDECDFSKLEGHWYPLEVIELGSHALQKGHEREFILCTLLVLLACLGGYTSVAIGDKFTDRASDYQTLSTEASALIMALYAEAERVSRV